MNARDNYVIDDQKSEIIEGENETQEIDDESGFSKQKSIFENMNMSDAKDELSQNSSFETFMFFLFKKRIRRGAGPQGV